MDQFVKQYGERVVANNQPTDSYKLGVFCFTYTALSVSVLSHRGVECHWRNGRWDPGEFMDVFNSLGFKYTVELKAGAEHKPGVLILLNPVKRLFDHYVCIWGNGPNARRIESWEEFKRAAIAREINLRA